MGKGISKETIEKRKALDEAVRPWLGMGLSNKDIAELVDSTVMAVAYAVRRLNEGHSQLLKHPENYDAEHEADMLIEAKLAPTHKPKAHKIMVNGWENGRYIHRQMVDVSEFWGL